MLYGLLLNRTLLSQRSDWISDDGNVFVIYTIVQMAEDMQKSKRTVLSALTELEHLGLLSRVRQGWNKANRIYLQMPDDVQFSASPESNICAMDVQDSASCMVKNVPPNNTDIEYTDKSKKDREDARHACGQYQNVYLTGKQRESLEWDYPDKFNNYINRLSVYMETAGKHYPNHEATIRKWIEEDNKRKPAKNYDAYYTE